MVKDVTAKKHRYVMSLVTEYIGFCECARSGTEIYKAIFVEQAKALNITEGIEIWDPDREAWQVVWFLTFFLVQIFV